MASMPYKSPAIFREPPGCRQDEEPLARINLSVHVRQAHWSVQKQNRAATREQLDNLITRDQQRPERMRQLIVSEIPHLRRYSRLVLSDPQAADELVRVTLVRAVAAADSWKPDGSMRAWLFVIMRKVMRNDLRPARSAGVHLRHEFGNHPGAELDSHQESHDALFDLQRALNHLPDDLQQVLLLAAVDGLQYEDIALILGVTTKTVRSRLSRGRLALRTQMDGTRPAASAGIAPGSMRAK